MRWLEYEGQSTSKEGAMHKKRDPEIFIGVSFSLEPNKQYPFAEGETLQDWAKNNYHRKTDYQEENSYWETSCKLNNCENSQGAGRHSRPNRPK